MDKVKLKKNLFSATFFLIITPLFILVILNSSPARGNLSYIGKVEFKGKFKINGSKVGGLSSLHFMSQGSYLLAVSDDKGKHDFPRLFSFKMTLEPNKLGLVSNNYIYLKSSKNTPYPKDLVDFEGMTFLPNGHLILASEGVTDKKPRIAPDIFEFDDKLKFHRRWNVSPDLYAPPETGKHKSGIRENSGFESVTYSSFDDAVYFASEEPTKLDGKPSKKKKGGLIRIEKFSYGQAPARISSYLYELSPTKYEDHKKVNKVGLSELLSFKKDKLLALERSHKGDRYVVKLFEIKLSSKCAIPSNKTSESLSDLDIESCEKKELLDFSKFEKNFPDEKVNNIESITFGPNLPNGNRTLLFVNDNNFEKKDETVFMAFELKAD